MRPAQLRSTLYHTILSLATEDGINASGREEPYGCVFGRDTAITVLKLLTILSRPSSSHYLDTEKLLPICRRALGTLMALQGTSVNIESGEEPGKIIHEYRKDRYERLVTATRPWYIYPDGKLRNYDSLDATPLTLIAIHRYWELTQDDVFLLSVLPAVEKGLRWMMTYGDCDHDGLLEYSVSPERKHGGLAVQSWTDSHETLTQTDGTFPCYPIAPVEVQGYAWLAYTLWSEFYKNKLFLAGHLKGFAQTLALRARIIKRAFHRCFLMESNGYIFPAQALDGKKRQISTVTGNPLLLLWATYQRGTVRQCIVDQRYISDLISRAFASDLFDSDAGIRTMSSHAPQFNPGQDSYHNGSFWPKLNGMAHEGIRIWGHKKEADRLYQAALKPLYHFGTAIELYIKSPDGSYAEYRNSHGQTSCRQQAWSAAAALDLLTL